MMKYPDWVCLDCGLAHGRRNPRIATCYVDENGILPNTPYRCEGGKFVEAAE